MGTYFGQTEADYEGLLWEAAASGAEAVNVVVLWSQESVSSSSIEPVGERTVSDRALRRTLRYAEQLGLSVSLMPVVYVESRAEGRWRGTIEPDDIDAWWTEYREFVLHYASLTASRGIDWFFVGSELGSRERDEERWTRLIADVRALGHQRLSYSANWDRFEKVPFWSELDAIGVSLYEPLPGKTAEERRARVEAWRRHAEQFAASRGQPILIAEFGFPSRPSAAARPWDSVGPAAIDLELQSELVRAVLETWCRSDTLERIFLWNVAGRRGALDTRYSPRGKPAMDALRHWHSCKQGLE